MTRVTVCIATYNRAELLPLTLKSVLNQTYTDLEIIIVDDCSTDGTKKLVETKLLKLDPRIKYIRHETNKGLATARNNAIFSATGKYFTFVDDDDEWEKDFIEEFVKTAEKFDEKWCFCCGSVHINKKCNKRKLVPNFEGSLKEYIKQGFTPPVASQFYFLSSLKTIGGYNENIKSGVDHDLWLKLSFVDTNILAIDKALSKPNCNAGLNRMTTNQEKRLNGIKNSLEIWKSDIIKFYGQDFFEHFHKCYFQYTYEMFFINDLKNKNVKSAMFNFFKINNRFKFILMLLLKFLKRQLNRNKKEYIEITKPLFKFLL